MNFKNTGSFIKNLREEKNLNQEELANILFVHRTTVNKWEKGKSIPLNDTLLLLSDFFNVTIDEILAGKRLKKGNNNVTLDLLNKHVLLKKSLKISILILITVVLSFLIYYFITTYNSIHVYTISAEGNKYLMNDGLIITSNNKTYIKFGKIESIDYESYEINQLDLYTIKNNKKQLLYSGDPETIIMEKDSSKEIFKNIDFIKDKIYIKINEEELKLRIKKDFRNNSLFKNERSSVVLNASNNDSSIILKEPNKFTFNEEENKYILKEKNIEIIYDIYDNSIIVNKTNKRIVEIFNYNLSSSMFIFKRYYNNDLVDYYSEVTKDNSENKDFKDSNKKYLSKYFNISE